MFPTAKMVPGLAADASHRFATVVRVGVGSTFHREPFQRMIKDGMPPPAFECPTA